MRSPPGAFRSTLSGMSSPAATPRSPPGGYRVTAAGSATAPGPPRASSASSGSLVQAPMGGSAQAAPGAPPSSQHMSLLVAPGAPLSARMSQQMSTGTLPQPGGAATPLLHFR